MSVHILYTYVTQKKLDEAPEDGVNDGTSNETDSEVFTSDKTAKYFLMLD